MRMHKTLLISISLQLNHRLHGCRTEQFQAIRIDEAEKDQGEPLEIEAWTGFDFAEREGKYSRMTWR